MILTRNSQAQGRNRPANPSENILRFVAFKNWGSFWCRMVTNFLLPQMAVKEAYSRWREEFAAAKTTVEGKVKVQPQDEHAEFSVYLTSEEFRRPPPTAEVTVNEPTCWPLNCN